MTNFKDLSFFWANCHYLKHCLSFFRENDVATLEGTASYVSAVLDLVVCGCTALPFRHRPAWCVVVGEW